MFHDHFTSLIALVRILAPAPLLLTDLEILEGTLFFWTYRFADASSIFLDAAANTF